MLSTEIGKEFDKIQHPFMIKTIIKVDIEKQESESRSVVSDSFWLSGLQTVHGILQARIVEWVAVPFSRGSSQPRDKTQISCMAGRFFTSWVTREAWYYFYLPKFVVTCFVT